MIKKVLSLYRRYREKMFPMRTNNFFIQKNNTFSFDDTTIKNTRISIEGKNNNVLVNKDTVLDNCIVRTGNTNGNRINIGSGCKFKNVTIKIYGDNNTIDISGNVELIDTTLWIEDEHGSISIGENTTIYGKTGLAVMESTSITIGKDCMFSSEISFRTGDSHSIIDISGKRINLSKNIVIGNHCWIGTKVICLKGTELYDNCVIGAGSLLSGKYGSSNCVIAGVPARIIKTDINWLRERI